MPLVVDGQSLWLPLEPHALASSGLGNLLDMLQISNGLPADELPLTIESLSLDLDFDELHHVAAALADAHRYMDGSVVDYFRCQLDTCEADDGVLGPTKTLPVVLGILGAIEKRVRDVPQAVRSELLSVGARGASSPVCCTATSTILGVPASGMTARLNGRRRLATLLHKATFCCENRKWPMKTVTLYAS